MPLFRRQHVDLLQVEHHATVAIGTVGLYGHVSTWTRIAEGDVIYMPIVHLLFETGRGVHPVHHIIHLFRRQNVAVSMAEDNFRHIMDTHDILFFCFSDAYVHSILLLQETVNHFNSFSEEVSDIFHFLIPASQTYHFYAYPLSLNRPFLEVCNLAIAYAFGH